MYRFGTATSRQVRSLQFSSVLIYDICANKDVFSEVSEFKLHGDIETLVALKYLQISDKESVSFSAAYEITRALEATRETSS